MGARTILPSWEAHNKVGVQGSRWGTSKLQKRVNPAHKSTSPRLNSLLYFLRFAMTHLRDHYRSFLMCPVNQGLSPENASAVSMPRQNLHVPSCRSSVIPRRLDMICKTWDVLSYGSRPGITPIPWTIELSCRDKYA